MKILAISAAFAASLLFALAPAAQEIPRPAERGWIDFKQPILPDPGLQHAKETYIQMGCAYCHGVDLRVRNGEAADLLHSGIVGADEDGKIIAGLLRTGIPQTAKLSPMPSFSDLSDRELADISRWVHYARMEGHYGELMQTKAGAAGDSLQGKIYFDKNCQSCHSVADVQGFARKQAPGKLKAAILKPAFLETPVDFRVGGAASRAALQGRAKHSHLLENYTERQVADLMAYISDLLH